MPRLAAAVGSSGPRATRAAATTQVLARRPTTAMTTLTFARHARHSRQRRMRGTGVGGIVSVLVSTVTRAVRVSATIMMTLMKCTTMAWTRVAGELTVHTREAAALVLDRPPVARERWKKYEQSDSSDTTRQSRCNASHAGSCHASNIRLLLLRQVRGGHRARRCSRRYECLGRRRRDRGAVQRRLVGRPRRKPVAHRMNWTDGGDTVTMRLRAHARDERGGSYGLVPRLCAAEWLFLHRSVRT